MKKLIIYSTLSLLLSSCGTQYTYVTIDSEQAKKDIEKLEKSLPTKSGLASKCKEARNKIFRTPNAFNSSYYSRGDIVQLSCLYGAIDGINRDESEFYRQKTKNSKLKEQIGEKEYARWGYEEIRQQYESGYNAGIQTPTKAEIIIMEQEYHEKEKNKKRPNEIDLLLKELTNNEKINERHIKKSVSQDQSKPPITMNECNKIARSIVENYIPKRVSITLQEYNSIVDELYILCVAGGIDAYQYKKVNKLINYHDELHRKAYFRGYAIGLKK